MSSAKILITGATGYIGGRLRRRLEDSGHPTRCLARRPENLRERVGPRTEVVRGDVLDPESLGAALEGIDVAYYLVHSMGSSGSFENEDRIGAQNFANAARDAGVRRIVYLGALGDDVADLSPHLRSRHEVGEIFRGSGVPTIELRASIVIGSGSLSFEMVRALVERLPVMVMPRWVSIPAQPISIDDILACLTAALDTAIEDSPIYEVGGRDVVTYADLMREYARQRGLRRWMIPVPVLTPRLSSLWLGLVTPLFARIGRNLIESIYHPTVVRNDRAASLLGEEPMGVSDAIAAALRNEERDFAETRWSDALSSAGPRPDWGGRRFGNRLVDSRSVSVPQTPAEAFAPIRRIGGDTGWYYADWLWQIRGAIDLLFGGVGMRRRRGETDKLRVGDTLDCWRVEALEPDRSLRLAAEMKLPGRAWLEFEVREDGRSTTIRQTAIFDPAGLWGIAYWYGIYPIHQAVFAGMLRGIARAAEIDAERERRGKASDDPGPIASPRNAAQTMP